MASAQLTLSLRKFPWKKFFFSELYFLLIMPVLVSTWDFLEAHAEGWRVLAAGDVHKKNTNISSTGGDHKKNTIKIFHQQVVLL